MANNCLVTKLKSAVNSSDLPLFNSFKFKIVQNADLEQMTSFIIKSSSSLQLMKPDGNIISNVSNVNLKQYLETSENEDLVYTVIGKYGIYQMNYVGTPANESILIDTEDLKYMPINKLVIRGADYDSPHFHITGITGKLSNIGYGMDVYTEESIFDFTNTMITATDEEQAEFLRKFPNIRGFGSENTNVILNWDLLAEYTYCNLNGNQGPMTGDIYNFIKKARLLGKTTGEIKHNYLNMMGGSDETMNGETLPSSIFSSISWTENTVTVVCRNTSHQETYNKTWNI